jgi:hypothetical protein
MDPFEELLKVLRAIHAHRPADKLDSLLHKTAWTTSSELLGELGLVVREVRESGLEGGRALKVALDGCAAAVRKAWPDFK